MLLAPQKMIFKFVSYSEEGEGVNGVISKQRKPPCHLQKRAGQNYEKPKGRPLEEKKEKFKKILRLIQE